MLQCNIVKSKAGVMAQSTKCLSCKQEDLSSVPIQISICIPNTGKVENRRPLHQLQNRYSQLVSSSLGEKHYLKKQTKIKTNKIESNSKKQQMLTSGLHALKYIGPHLICAYLPTLPNTFVLITKNIFRGASCF